ncbi:NADP-dependent oxidoreductase [Deinococcus arcticus]|uniref:Enoyl reductase (ER) domain-containing protein n=1 Tax=Deinococcus arcticus TaxID=2136176 RepID=A0A2T3W765_9DEIO|nr:NADP-dependent oxidoreductase [Deinococcus arcticus]PTA67593.1 hypothetical protein C8263_12225 [Deinococcus arcticus]
MRAARLRHFGGPEVLRVEEVPWPAPGGDEVLVRVAASSVNATDLALRAGGLGPLAARQLPLTVGFDVCGEVVACGPRVTAFRPGERVYALLGLRAGGSAEYVTVRQGRAALAPRMVPAVQAAAVPLAALTALQALRAQGGLQPRRTGQRPRVLVYGAAGGIGSFAVGLARVLGALVTGVARPEKHAFVQAMGADEVLAPADLDWAQTGPWDVVLDTPPALSFAAVRPALGERGVLVSTRPLPTRLGDAAAMLPRPGPHPRLATMHTAERGLDLAFLARLIEGGELRVPVDRVFALDDIAAAHRYAEGDEVRGKVVVAVAEG